jgi:hypothetical protein
MLRSVVSAMAANMMLVQCNSDVPISLACSMRSASALSTASPEPRPVGTSKARDQAGSSLEPLSSAGMKHRSIEPEVGVIFPHAVQDHGDAPGQRHPLLETQFKAMQIADFDASLIYCGGPTIPKARARLRAIRAAAERMP